jgi:TatA/E family protein of Tat protein translocase
MFGLGTKEIIIIAVVIVLLFGSKKIPELAKNLVEAFKNLTSIFKGPEEKTMVTKENKK